MPAVPGASWWSPRRIDLAVAAVVAVPTAMDSWWNEAGTRQADGWTYALTVVSIGALLLRRRHPFPVTLVCGAALTGWYVLGHHGELLNLPTMVGLYTIAVGTDRSTTLRTALVASAWSGVLGFTSDDPIGARGGSPVLEMIWPLVPLALGDAARSRRELLARAEADAERAARERVEAERVRIAGEFHDVVAHTIAAVNVQIGVAVAAFDAKPDAARSALHDARASTKEALRELRATVALLRDPDGEPLAPAPNLSQVADLAAPARAAGLDVTIDDRTDGLAVAATTQLAAYRIVQEAITNVLRHSDARTLTVSLRPEATDLVVEVIDDGRARSTTTGTGANGTGGGHGLAGMAERAGAVGGRVRHGFRTGGGFEVHAVLPTGGAA